MNASKIVILLASFALSVSLSMAQDTSRKTIEITSSFKPVLRPSEKLRFQATPPPPDTIRPRLQYAVPAQNVIPKLTPVSLKPIGVAKDTSAEWAQNSYIKLGYGNLNTPFIDAGLSVPAGKSRLNLMIDHISSSGKIPNQDYSETGVNGFLNAPLNEKITMDLKAGFAQDKYYLFGYDRSQYTFEREKLKQSFSTITGGISLRNEAPTEFGITYHPQVDITVFSDNRKNSESNFRLKAPVEKFIGKSFGIRLGIDADITRFSPDKKDAITNNLFQVPVALTLRTPNLQVNAGLTPSWDNGSFTLLPDFLINFPLSGDKWIFQGGWTSYFRKGDYRQLAAQNPYLNTPKQLQNNRVVERFAGFKGTLPNHVTYSAKLGYVEFNQMPLFVNDTLSGKSFDIIFEQQLKAIQLQGEIGYIMGEKFSATARFNWYKFNAQKTADRPWGLVPLELSTRLRWNILKELSVTTDFFMWDGPLFVYQHTGKSGRSPGAFDLNAGLEFRVTKKIYLWSQFNNIFNSGYQRWNQYTNYGFNMLVGGIFRFAQ